MNPSTPATPGGLPAWGSTSNPTQSATQDVAALAPLATSWHGAQNGVAIQHQAPTAAPSQGVLPAFWGHLQEVGKETGSLTQEAGSWVKTQVVNGVEAPIKFGASIGHGIIDHMTVDSLSKQTQELNTQLDNIMQGYKSGQLSKVDYLKALNEYNQNNANVSSQLSVFESKTSTDQQNATTSAIGVATDVLSLMSGGIGAGLKAPELLAGNSAAASLLASSDTLAQGAAMIEKLASSEADWGGLSSLAQQAMRTATSQALEAAGTSATAGQVTRAAAADVLLKFPLYFNAMSGTGSQVYDQLNNNKYGDAVKTIAFNAALMFAGGPIGWGLKQAKGVAQDALVASGLRTGSMLDELSSRIGNGDRLALGKIAGEQVQQGNNKEVKAMIVGLESNLKASGGNPAAAVNKITDHLENYIGWGSMKNLDHQQAWDNIVSYWQHATGLQDLKAAGKIEGMAADDSRVVVPGRFTTGDKNGIATAVIHGDLAGSPQTIEARLQAWQDYKTANPNAAFANNVNVDKQVTNLIKTTDNPVALHTAINKINTQLGLSGIPKDYAAKMAKDGYIAIVPAHHNLPVMSLSDTSGKLASAAVNDGNFFVKAATPVPVMQSVGNFLVNAGLSPQTAGQTVQNAFNEAFTKTASSFGFLTGDETGKDVISKLSNYMKAPTGGPRVFGNVLPITDMRQLTTGDIMRALNVSRSDAKDVGAAIMQAHLDVPVAIKGLGVHLNDLAMKANPISGFYSRVQGAFRFSWNPVFSQAKLPIKAEILSQMETGGKFPTIAGTNTFMSMFFPGQYKELNSIVANPDFKGLFTEGIGGEASGAETGIKALATSEMPPKNAMLPIAGVIQSMADKVGMNTADFLKQFPTESKDAATAILHYDRNNSFLNSPLAKTLNFAFFPFRFNVKVSTFMASFLAKQPPGIQYAAIKGLMDSHKFLNSPQGQAWYSQHSDVIGLIKYVSPLETISTIANVLGMKHDSISQYGELGGLPFGWIPQALDASGLTHFGQAYVNPKSGEIAKDYIPTSAYGALNVAVQDLLGSLFTYPGATAGLPSKGSIERNVVGGLLPGSKGDFKAVEPTNVTPEEQQFSQIVKQTNGTAPTPGSQTSAPPQTSKSSTVPAQHSPIETRLPKTAGGTKLKKSQMKPYLLPGQNQLGQL